MGSWGATGGAEIEVMAAEQAVTGLNWRTLREPRTSPARSGPGPGRTRRRDHHQPRRRHQPGHLHPL